MSALPLHAAEFLELYAIPDVQMKGEIARCLEVICEDFDLCSSAMAVIADPANAEESLRVLIRRSHCGYQAGESASSFAERSLRLQLREGEHMVLQAILGLVDRLAACMYPQDEGKRATVSAYLVGNANRRANIALGTGQ